MHIRKWGGESFSLEQGLSSSDNALNCIDYFLHF